MSVRSSAIRVRHIDVGQRLAAHAGDDPAFLVHGVQVQIGAGDVLDAGGGGFITPSEIKGDSR